MQTPADLPELDHPTLDAESIRRSLYNRLVYTIGKDPITATDRDWFHAAAAVVRERLIERWMETMRSYYVEDRKRVYYLSMEFLMGRSMTNAMLNICAGQEFQDALAALAAMGLKPGNIAEIEPDAALGNGGLGRLAACFLDSMATMGIAGYGYGIRYEYGMFHQGIEDGQQVEHPDNWLRYGNPWEFPRPEVLYQVKFHGRVVEFADAHGKKSYQWVETDDVMAMAYDYPIPGYDTGTVNNMRLWAAKASRDFDLKYFNEGNYIAAVEDKNDSENLSKVLYPDDTTEMGRELRLKQQYFFVSASLQDMLYRFDKSGVPLDSLPDKVAIQLNDTHPSIAVAELMRILIDLHHMDWPRAWDIVTRTFAYTNHTLMPEALEKWGVGLFERVLPRHLQIIYDINTAPQAVEAKWPGDNGKWRICSLIEENGGQAGPHGAPGRRRLATRSTASPPCTPPAEEEPLSGIQRPVSGQIPEQDQRHHAAALAAQEQSARSPRSSPSGSAPPTGCATSTCCATGEGRRTTRLPATNSWRVKRANKVNLAAVIRRVRLEVSPDAIFDVQIKRLHEYKRQHLNLLHILALYRRLLQNPGLDIVPRVFVFGAKAAPATLAKNIIRAINVIGAHINADPRIGGKLKVAFLPNYRVSLAEKIIPRPISPSRSPPPARRPPAPAT
jgi:starch phosphorylase